MPATYPLYGAGLLIFLVVFVLMMSKALPGLRKLVLSVALHPDELRLGAGVLLLALAALIIASHIRRRQSPPLPPYLRWNHAIFHGCLALAALEAVLIARSPAHLVLLLDETETQLIGVGAFIAIAAIAFVGWLWPMPVAKATDVRTYQSVIESLKNTYDFVLGSVKADDWKNAETGPSDWLILKESSLWTNIFGFGGIGSGKTTAIAYPFVVQALGKYPDDPELRPSLMILDLKGDNAQKIYQFAQSLGRDGELTVIRPGNRLKNIQGKDVIAPSRFRTWNPVGGDAPPEIRAAFLLDGLNAVDQATNRSSGSEYFERIEREFLIAAIAMFDVVLGVGNVTLYNLYQFCFDAEYREAIANDRRVANTDAKRYFEKAIEVLEDDQKTQLVSGLRAKIAQIATPVMQETFCAPPGSKTQSFEGFIDTIVNKPGVIVFSVDEGEFGREIARLLGVMFMRYFHQALLKRNASSFKAAGGNTQRLVLQVTDEAAAYMNPGVAEFTAVSRQARTCSVFLTQSLAQVPEKFRDVVEGNFRTKILLNVNDTLTLQRFEFLFGQIKEAQTNVSTSQNLNDVRHGVLTQTVHGKSQGLSVSTSTSEQLRPRFSASELLHMGGGRAVVQVYDGEGQRTVEATAMTTTPYFRLRYHLFHPLAHRSVRCAAAKGKQPHRYAGVGKELVCLSCKHELKGDEKADYEEYAAAFGHLLS
ncbi:MAG: TraM recognition domain-containing protein [Deltaproteobacteria bacterium]|nr:TraM recognition domain-containing protein [Deltaproteobacteria bacterium]